MPGEHLDLSSEPEFGPRAVGNASSKANDTASDKSASTKPAGRPFIGMQFACCDVYTRIYLNRQQTAYTGHCPRCSKRVDIKVGPGGTDSRFFTAY